MGFVPFPDSSGRPGMGHGDQPCHSRCLHRGSFPRDARPFEAFPLYAAILRVNRDVNRPSPFVDARLTDHSAPPGATGSLQPDWISPACLGSHPGRSRSGFPSRRCCLASASPLLPRSFRIAALSSALSSALPSWHQLRPGVTSRPQGLPPRTDPLHMPGVSTVPVPDASMGFLLCTHRPRGPSTSEEVSGRPAAAVLLRRQRRESEPLGADVMPDTERRAP